ncbi:hypothetical protein KAW18_00955 [candidate division WOR-3 bacterium]|nr:hypothetical protein [candidate division WOR-3 bacterium]
MIKEKFIKIILVLILILLGLNLVKDKLSLPLFYVEAQAETKVDESQTIALSKASGIACSADGKFVYVIGEYYDKKEQISNRECIYRSDNFGKPGSWQLVAKQNVEDF